MSKVLITHTDLDGIGCAILAIYFDNFDYIYSINYNSIDDYIDLINLSPENQYVITDLSLSEEQFCRINKISNVTIIDHHKSSNYLQKYKNQFVDVSKCGTKLFYEKYYKSINKNSKIDKFVEIVNINDLWLFNKYNFEINYNLNRLFVEMKNSSGFIEKIQIYNHGLSNSIYKSFIELIINKFLSKSSVFNYSINDLKFIDNQKQLENESKKHAEAVLQIRTDINGNKFGLTGIINGLTSLTGSYLLNKYSELKYIVLYFPTYLQVLSVRSINDFDCTQIPKINGHKNAAGGSFSEKFIKRLIKSKINDLFSV